MSELKRCPFCGGRASIRKTTSIYNDDVKDYGYGGYFVMCEKCLTSGNNYNTEKKAADAWNRRCNYEG